MKIKELLEAIDENVSINIDGLKLKRNEVPEKLMDLDINEVNIETAKVKSKKSEELGYSFEVGV